MKKPVLIIIAGPNGSGKTSITSKILQHEWVESCVYINPDNIANEKFGVGTESPTINASRIVDRAYIYDNSFDFADPQPLFRVVDGVIAKEYIQMNEWAVPILHFLKE